MRFRLAASALSLLAQAAPAPASPQAGYEAIEAASQALGRGGYLEAVDRARSVAFRGDGRFDPEHGWYWLQIHPYLGGTFDRLAFGPPAPAYPLDPERADRGRRAEVREAIAEIVARARHTSIVILNEDHRSPRDRAFALEVARALRPLGYTVLAAETFSNPPAGIPYRPMADLARDRFPRLRTGTYVLDPVFGDFVRQALAIGYRPVAYEPSGPPRPGTAVERLREREQRAAENLVASIFRADSRAKVMIYVGHSHVAEAPIRTFGQPEEWLAARLKRITGVDPLTIDQTAADELDPRARAWRGLLAPRLRARPSILFLEGAPLVEGEYRGAVDLQVVHPPLRLVRGRPTWLLRIGRRPVEIPRRLLPARGTRLIQAFVAGEPADAIPLDQVVVEAGSPAPPLMLRRGPVRWAWQDPVPP
ncbi:MAG TPA: hypothetical protein VD887_10300 [Allosphingosinicella sp.]|nr:hypothetical protein [Allosphingosinicella sp.]